MQWCYALLEIGASNKYSLKTSQIYGISNIDGFSKGIQVISKVKGNSRIFPMMNGFFNFYCQLEIAEAASYLLPDCDEWEAKEESQGASKVSNQGEKGVEKDLLLNLRSWAR